MKIHNSTKSFEGTRPIVTMGIFDGVHPGHKALLRRTVEIAKAYQTESVVLTFWTHPRIVLNQEPEKLRLLTTLDEKFKLIEELGVNNIIVLPFTAELASLTAEKFVEEILVNDLNTGCLVVGYNHRFGHGGITYENLQHLSEKFNFSLCRIPQIEKDGQFPSSTKIRNLLLKGDIQQANQLLGYRYIISGIVKEGNKIGRKLSYPTANILIDEPLKLIPSDGVYACFVKTNGDYFEGMVNIGVRPTFNTQNVEHSIEVHILDFKHNIYGEKIELNLVARMRDEIQFSNLYELKKQIKTDEINVRKIIKEELIDKFANIIYNNSLT